MAYAKESNDTTVWYEDVEGKTADDAKYVKMSYKYFVFLGCIVTGFIIVMGLN